LHAITVVIDVATEVMSAFAERTGLSSERPQERYLWTDAFAVENFLALGREDLARSLVDKVHRTLGRHRDDDGRTGWLSPEGESRPTLGGLRIGKELPERTAAVRFDSRLEWDRDGQYFHYLTKWMSALHRFGDPTFHRWAVDLAKAAYRGFVHDRRMYWKMSIDLSRPLVPSMGQHDPLDGLVTYLQLGRGELGTKIESFRGMLLRDLSTDDPLGLGGLFSDAHRLATLDEPELRARVVAAAELGLESYVEQDELRRPAELRLAFRELGLAIGLRLTNRERALADAIVNFWVDHRDGSWNEHRNINDVMLATALLTRA